MDSEPSSAGWGAIDEALHPIYGDQKPRHFGTLLNYRLGGPDPLDGISAYPRTTPSSHWHFVTYGFSELYEKEETESDVSGYGFELTFRLARGSSEDSPPNWSLNFLQNLARYVFSTGNVFASGHHMNLNGPIALEEETLITAIAFCGDSELAAIETPNGGLEFLQVVGITDDEFQATQAWNTDGVLEVMRDENPLLITDLGRGSMLDTPSIQETVDERKRAEGSTTSVLYNDATRWAVRKRLFGKDHVVVTIGANPARNVSMVLPGRIAFGRSLVLWSEKQSIEILPGEPPGVRCSGNDLKIAVNKSQAARIAEIASLGVGEYEIEGLPQLSIAVVPSIIRNQSDEEVKRVE